MNRFIAEKVMGVCWHRRFIIKNKNRCTCGFKADDYTDFCQGKNPDYTTGKDKAALMDKCVGEEWWDGFIRWAYGKRENEIYKPLSTSAFYAYLWRNLRELVAEYHGYNE